MVGLFCLCCDGTILSVLWWNRTICAVVALSCLCYGETVLCCGGTILSELLWNYSIRAVMELSYLCCGETVLYLHCLLGLSDLCLGGTVLSVPWWICPICSVVGLSNSAKMFLVGQFSWGRGLKHIIQRIRKKLSKKGRV